MCRTGRHNEGNGQGLAAADVASNVSTGLLRLFLDPLRSAGTAAPVILADGDGQTDEHQAVT